MLNRKQNNNKKRKCEKGKRIMRKENVKKEKE